MKDIIKISKYSALNNLNKKLKDSVSTFCGLLNSKYEVCVYFNQINKDNTSKIARKLNAAINKYLKPLPTYTISIVELDNFDAIRVDVSGDDLPYSCDDKYYIYKDEQLLIMNTDELSEFINLYKDNSNILNKETMYESDYLDIDALNEYFQVVYNKHFSNVEDLKQLGLILNNKLTLACFYLFSKTKLIKLNINNYKNNESIVLLDNLFNIFVSAEKYFAKNNIDDLVFKLLINVFLNSDFKQYIEINLNIDDDKLIILNNDYYKNAINMKNKVLYAFLNPYFNFKDEKEIFTDFKNKHIIFETILNNTSYEIVFKFENISERKPSEDKTTNFKTKDKFIQLLIRNPYLTNNEMASVLKTSTKTIQRKIKELKEKDIISREGNYRNGYWKINLEKLDK